MIATPVWLLMVLLAGAPAPEPPSPRGTLVRVPLADAASLHDLMALGLDVWEVDARAPGVLIRVSQTELQELRARGFDAEIIEADLYDRVPTAVGNVAGGDWSQYHNLASVNQTLFDLANAYPNLASLFTLGESWEERTIFGLRIGDDAQVVDHAEPAFFIVGCHHAREWVAVEVPLYIASRLLDDYESDAAVRSLLDRGEIWIVPVLNPDGFVYSQEVDRYWRGNRRPNEDGSYGVDLNRNYSYQWGLDSGSDSTPGSELYRGPAPLSEPETSAVSELFESRSFVAALSFHNFSQLVMAPYAYTSAPPPDEVELQTLVQGIADAINAEHTDPGYDYVAGQFADILYRASGAFEDWVYGVYGVAAVLVELRPAGSPYFELPANQILPTCVESYAGTLHYIERAFGPVSSPPGDFDSDGAIDLQDAASFVECMNGPAAMIPGFPLGCFSLDMDADATVTLSDFSIFVDGFGSP